MVPCASRTRLVEKLNGGCEEGNALLVPPNHGREPPRGARDVAPSIRAGGIAYACGGLVMVGAGLVSGFITTGVAALIPHATAADLQINL